MIYVIHCTRWSLCTLLCWCCRLWCTGALLVCSNKQPTKLNDMHCTIVPLNMQLYCTYIGSALAMKCTHTPELRLCALLAIRGGCKERTERRWSKIYSVRQKLHKGKVSRQEPVAAEPPGTPSCALWDTSDGKLWSFWIFKKVRCVRVMPKMPKIYKMQIHVGHSVCIATAILNKQTNSLLLFLILF